MKTVRKIWKTISQRPSRDDTGWESNRTFRFILLSLALACLITTIMDIIQRDWITSVLTAVFFLLFLWFFFVLKNRGWRNGIVRFTAVFCTAVFSFYYLTGTNNGFSAIWILIIPCAFMAFGDLRTGFFVSTYFMVFLVVFTWTPVRHLVTFSYSPAYRVQFPVLFALTFLLALVLNYQLQLYKIKQASNLDALNQAVLDERSRNLDLSMQTLLSISHAVEAKDQLTNHHSERVATYARLIAEQLGWNEENLELIYFAGLVHDIGKIGVPDEILNKKGKLTDEEFDFIRRHPKVGYEILKDFNGMEGIVDAILYHHERYDGKGYVTHLSGKDIPELARIICVADAFDAMNSDRVYRSSMSRDYILSELTRGKGTQFDPIFAQIMIDLVRSETVVCTVHC
ncbi:MAG: HD-GYP domain-containing protein [Oscillospiraceae bacterium]